MRGNDNFSVAARCERSRFDRLNANGKMKPLVLSLSKDERLAPEGVIPP
jgi:hypothetical protein